jgi:hypothetical protein
MDIAGVLVPVTTVIGNVPETAVTVPDEAGVIQVALPEASDVKTLPAAGVPAPENFTVPFVSNWAVGAVTPIPTLPLFNIENTSVVPFDKNLQLFPKKFKGRQAIDGVMVEIHAALFVVS